MGKASSAHDGNFIHVILEMVEDGQRLEFDVGPGTERKKIKFEIGHVHGYGELFVERFEPLNDGDELDLRVKLILPSGSGDRPAAAGPTLQGTKKHFGDLRDAQLKEAAALPKGEDGEAFADVKSDEGATVEIAEEPGTPTPEEIAGGIPTLQAAIGAPFAGESMSTMAASRQFTAPSANEEIEMDKLARASTAAVVTVKPEPTPEEIASLTNTTPPQPDEEKKLEVKARKQNTPGFANRLR